MVGHEPPDDRRGHRCRGQRLSETATLNLNGSSGDIFNKAVFKLDGQKTVYYTVTATGSQAPVISWLGVQRQPAETRSL